MCAAARRTGRSTFQQAPGQPTADQVLDKFVAALGGSRFAGLPASPPKGPTGFDDAMIVEIFCQVVRRGAARSYAVGQQHDDVR
jgi:hypothetical protein